MFLVWGIVGFPSTRVVADPQTFHIIDINEVYTNADGTKQFIELFAGSIGQTNLAPTLLIALNADGTDTNIVFDFTASFPALGANETILLATPDMAADLSFSPDFIIPANSIFLDNGRVIFEDPPPFPTMVDAVAYGNYTGSNADFGSPTPAFPSDGCRSLVRITHDYILPKDNAAQWGIGESHDSRSGSKSLSRPELRSLSGYILQGGAAQRPDREHGDPGDLRAPRVAVIINKKNLTHDFIVKSRVFGVSVLEESAPMTFFGPFGFKSGRDVDKLAKVSFKKGSTGCPLITEHSLSVMEAEVIDRIDLGSHSIFVADVLSSEVLKSGRPMTYHYFHEQLKGKSPKNAPTFEPPTSKGS